MNIDDQLKHERRQLERLQKDYKAKLPDWESRLGNFKNLIDIRQPGANTRLTEIQKQFDLWKGLHDQAVENTKLNIKALEEQLREQDSDNKQRARAALEAMKADMLKSWKQEGGDEARFNTAWPDMEKDILKKRVSDKEADAIEAKAKIRQEKRARLGGL